MADPPAPDPARGVFTTALVAGGTAVALDAHLERLAVSIAALYDERLPDDCAARASAAARGLELGRLRISYRPGGGLEVTAAELDPATVLPGWEGAVDLRPVALAAWDGSHKWADRHLLDALERDGDDRGDGRQAPLIVIPTGTVLETTRATVFAVRDGRLVTPPASAGVLPGVVRAAVLDLAAAAGIDAGEAPLTLAQLAAADEAFVTNALRLLEPVRSLDGAPIPGPGPVTAALAARLRALWLPAGFAA